MLSSLHLFVKIGELLVGARLRIQEIHISSILEDDRRNREFRVIELKDEPLALGAYRQLWRYVEWTKSYVPGAINSNVQPIIVTCRSDSGAFDRAAVGELDALNSEKIAKVVKFFEYDIRDNRVAFNEVDYS